MNQFGPRAAVGHMPFPGHRTCAEWGKPCFAAQEPAATFTEPHPGGETEADRLSRFADIPLYLAQLVVMRANAVDCDLRFLRGSSRATDVCALRASIAREALKLGYPLNQVSRALNRRIDQYVPRGDA